MLMLLPKIPNSPPNIFLFSIVIVKRCFDYAFYGYLRIIIMHNPPNFHYEYFPRTALNECSCYYLMQTGAKTLCIIKLKLLQIFLQ